jgi:TPR repeat protein
MGQMTPAPYNRSFNADTQERPPASPALSLGAGYLQRYAARMRVVALVASFFVTVNAQAESCLDAYQAKNNAAEAKCKQLAEAGEAEAQLGYALILLSGHARNPEPAESLKWLRMSATRGSHLARVALGRLLSDEQMLAPALRDPVEGYAWWVTAGEKDAAALLLTKMPPAQRADAERKAADFLAKYSGAR